jgi:hypothetical protein
MLGTEWQDEFVKKSKSIVTFSVAKGAKIIWATSVIFTKNAQRKQSPNGWKFAQSGYPVGKEALLKMASGLTG